MKTKTKMTMKSKGVVPDNACPECGALMRKQTAPMSLPVHGEEVTVVGIEHWACPACGETMTDVENTGKLFLGALDGYRRRHDLLQPQEVRAVRERFQLSQASLALLLRTTPEEVMRWEDGRRVQTPMEDLVLRLLRDVPGSYELVRRRRAA